MSSTAEQAAARITKALEMGPTPGNWTVYKPISTPGARLGIDAPDHSIILWGDREEDSNGIHGRNAEEEKANAAYIAACSPDNLRALLAERDELRKALQALLDDEGADFIRSRHWDAARAALTQKDKP